ncbi:MAG: hypothetical protein WC373_06235 [Smithella sp.]|jgi:hypothetical protein
MKKAILIESLALFVILATYPTAVQSQPRGYYGYGTGRGYGRQSSSTARAMMQDYLKSSRNPDLKLGKIKIECIYFIDDCFLRAKMLVSL